MIDLIIKKLVKKKYNKLNDIMNCLDLGDVISIVIYFTCLYQENMIDGDQIYVIMYASLNIYDINELHIRICDYLTIDYVNDLVKTYNIKYHNERYLKYLFNQINKSDGLIRTKYNKRAFDINYCYDIFEKIITTNVIKMVDDKYGDDEIKNKLLFIRDYYGLNILILFNVNIVTSEYFDNMTLERQIEYYNDCCYAILLKMKKFKNILSNITKLKKKINSFKIVYKDLMDKSDNVRQISENDVIFDIVDDFIN
jgi:hypothetical protein